MRLGKPQRFGTQYRLDAGKWVLYAVDPAVTDEERQRWGVPPLAQARRRADEMNHVPPAARGSIPARPGKLRQIRQ